MDYSFIVEDMLWSYSRLSSFDDCKYGWLLKYVRHQRSPAPQFFSSYGTFMHSILEQYLSGKLEKEALVPYYLEHYDDEVVGVPPSSRVSENFFEGALHYLETIDFPLTDIIETEKQVFFHVGDYRFVGYIDVLACEGTSLHIVDHKSHGLRNRSGRKYQTEYDKELDRYLRQQYLYSIPIKDEFGKFPKTLNFNCYRHGRFITEPFDLDACMRTQQWALDQIDRIKHEQDWEAKPDVFFCTYLCDVAEFCPYRKGGAQC